MNKIDSKDNGKIKKIGKLKQKKYRERYRQSLVEGLRAVKQLLDNGIEPEQLLFSEEAIVHEELRHLHDRYEQKSFVVKTAIFESVAETVHSQGLLAIFNQPSFDYRGLIEQGTCRAVLLDQLQDPGNLGTIIRTADSAGFDMILYTKGTADIFSEKVSRSAMGANFYMPSFCVNPEKIMELREKDFELIAAMLDEQAIDYAQASYPSKLVLVLGNEANGVSTEIAGLSTQRVMIPIYGRAESLNVAVAAGILMYRSL